MYTFLSNSEITDARNPESVVRRLRLKVRQIFFNYLLFCNVRVNFFEER